MWGCLQIEGKASVLQSDWLIQTGGGRMLSNSNPDWMSWSCEILAAHRRSQRKSWTRKKQFDLEGNATFLSDI